MIIRQRTDHDCFICCCAMLIGRTYEEIVHSVGDLFDPSKGVKDDHRALERMGFKGGWLNGEPAGTFIKLHRMWGIHPELYRRFAWGRRALLTVPSLNNPGGWHMVYYDGLTLYDPSNKKTYSTLSKLPVEEVVLFLEAQRSHQ